MDPTEPRSDLHSLEPVQGADRSLRRRLRLRDEFLLALLPTTVVLLVLALIEALTEQRLLFASLASSAFLIYLDPQHGTNTPRTLVISQLIAALLGWITFSAFGSGYLAGGAAMVLSIAAMIALDVVHPPAVATAMSFALRAGETENLLLFALALGITAILIVLQRAALWLLARHAPRA
jgi:CBS-domain-containing membrane protein